MKKVLVAIDVSGSISRSGIKRVVSDVLSNICPSSEVQFGTFDQNFENTTLVDIMNGDIRPGGGTDLKCVFEVAEDFDHTFILSDGYFDKKDSETIMESDEMSLVIL